MDSDGLSSVFAALNRLEATALVDCRTAWYTKATRTA